VLVYDETGEWAERLDAVTGGSSSRGRITQSSLEEGYEGLTIAQVLVLADEYGASIIVTPADYPFDEFYRAGGIHVYWIGSPD
jgi:hypothetical protein